MASFQTNKLSDWDTRQATITLKKGAYLLKYGRRGKPKFCPFRLSNDERYLTWFSGKREKKIKLSHVTRIIPGQRTAVFQRYPQPDKEYQSFSLICKNRSLDLICKDKDEAEVWFSALRALISQDTIQNSRTSDGSQSHSRRSSVSNLSCSSNDIVYKDPGDRQTLLVPYENSPQYKLGKAFSEVVSYTAAAKAFTRAESVAKSLSLISSDNLDDAERRSSAAETSRVSASSAVSSSSQGSCFEDFESLGDVLIWGECIRDGMLGGSVCNKESPFTATTDALIPKVLELNSVIDVHDIAFGSKHAVLVTKRGQVLSWGQGSGGRLGHGVDNDTSQPKLIDDLSGLTIELVECGEFHSCAVTVSGDLYTWGDGTQSFGLLGHGTEIGHWTPKLVCGQMEGQRVSCISCGPWHTAAVTSTGKLFTFGDGSFGALGHGDLCNSSMPREVEILKGLRTLMVSCGVWHTAAVVEVTALSSNSISSSVGKLFTWGDGDKGQLGHSDKKTWLIPSSVTVPEEASFCQVACGQSLTVALTTSGKVYAMGSPDYGQLGNPENDGMLPTCVAGGIRNSRIEQIACGSHHVAALSSKAEVFTWGKGANGQLGHGDKSNKNMPALVKALRDKQVKRVVCGFNFTAAIVLKKWGSTINHSICSGCQNSFNFRRKRHNCYNCGLVFCKACSQKKSLKAALAPNTNKPYRVCDDCFIKLRKNSEPGSPCPSPNILKSSNRGNCNKLVEKESLNPESQHHRSKSFSLFQQAVSKDFEHIWRKDFLGSAIGGFRWGSTLALDSANSIPHIPSYSLLTPDASPISRKSITAQSVMMRPRSTGFAHPEATLYDSKQTNGRLDQEILILREKVENLTQKSQLLEAELGRTSRKLTETTLRAREEAERNKAAKRVIRCLTAQLKNMAQEVREHSLAQGESESLSEGTSLVTC